MSLSRLAFLAPLLASVLSLPGLSHSFSFNRNGAHINWKSSETEHFRFTYPAEIEPAAEYIAGIAEGVAEDKFKRYHIRFPNKVEMIIREDIYSNGWANSLQNTMTVWISDWDFPIRSTHDWLRDVVTHEFSHLVSIQSSSKFPSPIQGLVIGYQSYFNAPVQPNFATIIPFTSQPNWFAEGVAQYESEYSGFDAWDSHRDMILRVASQENKLIGYDRMGTFTGTSIEYEQGPYTQGFAFVKFIAGRYGDGALTKLWAENSRLHRQTLSGAMERVIGKSGPELWEEWKSDLTARYAEQVKALGPLTQGQKLTSEGFYNYYPRWDSKGENIFFVSNRGRDDFKGSLYIYKVADTAKKEDDRIKLMDGGIRSPFSVAGDDSTVLFHSAKEEDKNGMRKFDVFQRKTGRKRGLFDFGKDKTELRYTKALNAITPSYDREGKRVVFVRNRLTNFYLCVAPVPESGKPDPEDVKTIWPSDSAMEGRFGFNIYNPRFSPDGKSILFSYYDGTSRNIGLVGSDGTGFKPLLTRPYDERDPEWAPDGKSFYFSADSGGIYNIYGCDLASGALQALTQVMGGAFAPAIDPSGKRLAYVNYDKDGFSLYLLPEIKPAAAPPVVTRVLHPEHDKIEPIDFSGKAEKYLGIPNRYILNPILFGEELSASTRSAKHGEAKWLAGFNGLMNDPVFKNEVSAALLVELGSGFDYFGHNDEILSPDKESQFYVGWSNHALPVTLGASFSRGNLTTHDTVTIRSVNGADHDSVGQTNYAVTFRDAEASLSYTLFDADAVGEDYKTSFARLAGGYSWNDFNFYDVPFGFEYYRNFYATALLSLYSAAYSDKEIIAPQGMAASIAYTYNHSGIIRRGSFLETFDFSDGFIKSNFRFYDIHDLDAGATYGAGLPWAKNGALLLSGFAGSILDWTHTNKDTARDTLDTFFSKGMFLRGYPYLRDVENLAFQGENVVKVSADLNQPLLPDIYRGYWIVFVEDLYFNLFWEAGRAWNGPLVDANLFQPGYWDPARHADGWYQSAGWGLKLNAKIYHNYPFLAYFEAATALSGVPDGKGGLVPLDDIRVGSLNTYATRISFGVSFGLYNGLLGKMPEQNPLRRNRFSLAR
jgi:Tol biopolymer transport system component